jgi:hypothetical protein
MKISILPEIRSQGQNLNLPWVLLVLNGLPSNLVYLTCLPKSKTSFKFTTINMDHRSLDSLKLESRRFENVIEIGLNNFVFIAEARLTPTLSFYSAFNTVLTG